MPNRTDTFAMFAKRPRPGYVKSRLAAATSPQWAAQAAEAFLRDLIRRFSRLAVQRIVVFDPPEESEWFEDLVHTQFDLVPQILGDLGGRLSSFLQERIRQGDDRVVMVGMDSPTLPLTLVERAFDELKKSDIALGPATDGGYYLVGCRRFEPLLFSDIDWSGPDVLRQTVNRVQECNLRLSLLRPWYDVDTLDDWQMLRGHVAAMRAAGVDPDLPETEPLLFEEQTCDPPAKV